MLRHESIQRFINHLIIEGIIISWPLCCSFRNLSAKLLNGNGFPTMHMTSQSLKICNWVRPQKHQSVLLWNYLEMNYNKEKKWLKERKIRLTLNEREENILSFFFIYFLILVHIHMLVMIKHQEKCWRCMDAYL